MKVIGLTGGIGSGKSTIAGIFEHLGVPVYNSDKSAQKIYFKPEVKKQVIELIGAEAYLTDSSLNKEFIAAAVFSDHQKLEQLNSIIHPAVAKDFKEWKEKQHASYLVKESALLFETGIYKEMDALVLVSADKDLRIERVKKRDHLTEEQVLQRINKQMPEAEKEKLAQFIVSNNERQLVIPQVLKIHQKIVESLEL